MTQEHEDLLALAAAHLLDPARTGRRLAATVRCYTSHGHRLRFLESLKA